MTTGIMNPVTITSVRVPHWGRSKADVRDVAMRVNQFAGRRTTRSSSLSHFLVLLKYQLHRREPRRERVASRGRSGTIRWSTEPRQVSAFVHHQAVGVYSCFREIILHQRPLRPSQCFVLTRQSDYPSPCQF